MSVKRKLTYLFKLSTIGADDHDVVPYLPVVVVTFHGFLEHFPGSGFLPQLDVRVGQVVPRFEVLLKNGDTMTST